ncbi:DUF2953 domain-containing protein [Lentibacillus lipolyticus]|nr:DUF2953 domain-containing protein [Lentibacillus lipolyticus]
MFSFIIPIDTAQIIEYPFIKKEILANHIGIEVRPMVIGLVIVIMITVSIILLCSRVKAVCSVTLNQEEQTLYLAVYLYRLRLLRRSIDLMEHSDQEQSFQETLSQLHQLSHNGVQKIRDMHTAATIIFDRILFHQITWNTEAGTGKADTTGMVTGGIWGVKGMVIGLLASKSTFVREPSISVTPFFNQQRIRSVFDCMISIRVGQAIYAFLKIIRKLPAKREVTT